MKTKIIATLLVIVIALLGLIGSYLRPVRDHSTAADVVTPKENWPSAPVIDGTAGKTPDAAPPARSSTTHRE